jgi:hypothetical protein
LPGADGRITLVSEEKGAAVLRDLRPPLVLLGRALTRFVIENRHMQLRALREVLCFFVSVIPLVSGSFFSAS